MKPGVLNWTPSVFGKVELRIAAVLSRVEETGQAPSLQLDLFTSAHDAFNWRTGCRVQLARHAAGEIGLTAGEYRVLHRLGHQHWLLSRSNAGIHQDGVVSQLHGNGGIGGCAHARI